MAPRKHRHSDNPDWEYTRATIEAALVAYDNWLRKTGRLNDHEMVGVLGEALADCADHLRISVLVYGKEQP